jgi:exodeoxyribonuclease VII small subunit
MAPRKKDLKFEGAMEKLEEIVEKMGSEDLSLEDSIQMFQEGMELVSACNKKLDEAERKISIILKNEENQLIEGNFEPQED